MDGDHTLGHSYAVHHEVLKTVFDELYIQGVELDQMILCQMSTTFSKSDNYLTGL